LSIVASFFLVLVLVVPVLGASTYYLDLDRGGGFAGRCNLRFYEADGSRVSTSESIRYMVVWTFAQADDSDSLLMAGEWAANTTIPAGVLVMGWKSIYGPYPDKASYTAKNCTTCNVTPDYFWVSWGLLGDYTAGVFSLSRPFMTLSGTGVGVDWGEEEVLSLGTIALRGRIALSGAVNDTTIRYYKPSVTVQAMQLNSSALDTPHWSAYGSVKLDWQADGDDCWDNLCGNYSFVCDWLYAHFGLSLCEEN